MIEQRYLDIFKARQQGNSIAITISHDAGIKAEVE